MLLAGAWLEVIPMALRWPARLAGAGILLGVHARILRTLDLPPRRWLRFHLTHPVAALVALIAVNLAIQEFFPFSHFPMYSQPDSEKLYYYLAGSSAEGAVEPLPVLDLTGFTSGKIGKMYRSARMDYCAEMGIDRDDLTRADREAIGRSVLEFIYSEETAYSERPATWHLMEGSVAFKDGALRETSKIIASQRFP